MRDKPLPPDLTKYNLQPDLTYRGNNEWSASCPQCGGADTSRRDKSDRFRLFAATSDHDARVWCRNCGFFEWTGADAELDVAKALKAKAERKRLAEAERQRIKSKIKDLETAAFWKGWHAAMTDLQRDLWRREGIIDYAIDYYKLGYCAEYVTGDGWKSPSMTIPHWGKDWHIVNVQHRLLEPPRPNDKYRQTAGLPASMFLTEPDEELGGPALIVEGAKKAIVTYTNLGEKPLGRHMLTVGIPSKTPSAKMLEQLKDCEPVYLMLDPDAYFSNGGIPAVNRVTAKLGRGRVRVVKLAVKPDDFFNIYGGKTSQLLPYLKQAVAA
jgi:hypothetical protein